jgi:large subunit ribosomal protein L30
MARKKNRVVKVTLTKGVIGEKPKTRATVAGLGLKRIHQTVEQVDSPSLRGMLAKVSHLVDVEEG